LETQTIIAELEAKRNKLDEAIRALVGSRRGPGRPKVGSTTGNGRRGGRRLSASARKRISDGMKRRWAKAKAAGRNAL
jgi:hypothetical protein